MKISTFKKEVLPNQTTENEMDLRTYWNTFNKYKWQVILLTLLIGLLTTLMTFSLQPVYRSMATLLIELEQPKVISIEEVYGLNSFSRDYYQTQVEILKSRRLAEKVVDELNLVAHKAYAPKSQQGNFYLDWQQWIPSTWFPTKNLPQAPPTIEQRRKEIVNTVMTHLSIVPVRNSQLVKLSFESYHAQLAAKVPNTLAELYVDSDLEAKLEMTHRATSWLTKRIEGLRHKLRNSEQALQAYLERENLVNVVGVKSISTRKIEETTSSLVKAHQRLAETESIYIQVRALKGKPTRAFESIPAVLNHSLVQNLKAVELETESKVSEYSKRYGTKHPKMVAARTELKTAQRNTARQIQRVVEGITKEYEVAFANVNVLKRSIKQQEQQIQSINRKEYQLGVLERDVEVNRQLYDLFLTRFKETDASQDVQALQSTVGRLIDLALVATVPYKPQKKRIVMISLVLGFLFSTMLAFLLEYLDNTIKNAEDVEQKLGLSLLGSLPKVKIRKKQKFQPQLMFLGEQKSHFAESVRTIRTGIMLSSLDVPHKIIVVTSSSIGDGKTTFAINQALALGQMKKTLLIDADMRRPSVAKAFNLDPKSPGLSELMIGTREFAECCHHIEEEGGNKIEEKKVTLDVLPSGTIPPNPLELLSSQRFKEFLAKLEQEYEYIVIDSTPTLAVSDALMLSKYASTVVYVVKADATPYQIVQEGLKRLHQVEAPIQGVVLNQVNVKKLSRYYYNKYGYYHGYYSGYGDYGYSQS
ncbi:polysaccharide biosynthesis tyrosine autokinase [Candidatus Parabeggiatoa sp. HSG14]|uniref:GumC family protein n=1 Tax=Candidatus Parabeggiatoa sp. HSG14 TaxID=3055593 RepID=UPI0025A6E569|nr:polysaccharide biosynthesis tyrosine autokinase [Thiotrichales bacterium HSG14]